jgi:hypothetical protein
MGFWFSPRMNIVDLYLGCEDFVDAAQHILTMHKCNECVSLSDPEVISYDLYRELLGLNYMWTLGFSQEKKPFMGEIGGVVPILKNRKRVLAVCERNIQTARGSLAKLKVSSNRDAKMDMPTKEKGDLTVFSTTYDRPSHVYPDYDFITKVACRNPLDILEYDPFLHLSARGIKSDSRKKLATEQYIFAIPYCIELSDRLSEVEHGRSDIFLDILKESKDMIAVEGHIAGFHLVYVKDTIDITPIITDVEEERNFWFFHESYIMPIRSDLSYLGIQKTNGDIGLIRKMMD